MIKTSTQPTYSYRQRYTPSLTPQQKERKRKTFSFLMLICLFLSGSFSSSLKAQYNCSSNDVRIVNAYLSTTVGGEITCTVNDQITANLHLIVSTKTGRKGAFISADLYINGSKHSTISKCFSDDLNGTNNDLVYEVNIPCPVGKLVELRNVFIAWGTGQGQFCPSTTPATPAKCRFKEGEVVIVELLGSGFTFLQAEACNENTRSVTFTGNASGGTPPYKYEWFIDYGLPTESLFSTTAPTTATTDKPSHSFTSDQDYLITLKVTDANGDEKISTKTVPVTACCVPSEEAALANSSKAAICVGSSADLSVIGGSLGTNASWKWYTGGCGTENGGTLVHTGASFTVSPSVTTTYYVRAEGDCGTTSCVSVTLNVNQNPSVDVGGTLAAICQGGTTAALGGSFDGGATAAVWSDGGAGGSFTNNDGSTPGTATYTAAANAPSSITLTLTTSGGSCGTISAQKNLAVNPSTGATSFTLPVTTVCQDAANTTYTATAANSTSIVYSVLPAGAGTINSATGETNWNAAFSGQATIKAVASGLCGSTETEVVVTVNPTFCVAYTGDLFKNTDNPAGGTASVNLVVVVTKSPSTSPAALNPGTFTMLVDGSALSNASVTTTPSADGTQITYSAPYTVTLPYQGTSLSRDLTVTWTFGNSCTISSCSETSTIVTVSAPADDFVTGGGYIIPTDSYFKGRPGSIGDMHVNGAKNNFGFNVKWNKSLKNLQGNWNTIIRRMESDGIHLYQVKAKPSTLVVTKISDKSYRADMVFTSVNFKDLTTGLWSDGGGSSSVNVTVIDNGEPASGVDQIFISIKDKNGSPWYTSSTSTLPANIRANDATIKYLTRGNIQVHVAGAKGSNQRSVDPAITSIAPESFNLKVLPNPSSSYFTVNITANSEEKMQVRVMDIMGRNIETLANMAPNQSIRLGMQYRPGLYFVELTQGTKKQQVKLIKQ